MTKIQGEFHTQEKISLYISYIILVIPVFNNFPLSWIIFGKIIRVFKIFGPQQRLLWTFIFLTVCSIFGINYLNAASRYMTMESVRGWAPMFTNMFKRETSGPNHIFCKNRLRKWQNFGIFAFIKQAKKVKFVIIRFTLYYILGGKYLFLNQKGSSKLHFEILNSSNSNITS